MVLGSCLCNRRRGLWEEVWPCLLPRCLRPEVTLMSLCQPACGWHETAHLSCCGLKYLAIVTMFTPYSGGLSLCCFHSLWAACLCLTCPLPECHWGAWGSTILRWDSQLHRTGLWWRDIQLLSIPPSKPGSFFLLQVFWNSSCPCWLLELAGAVFSLSLPLQICWSSPGAGITSHP